MTKQPPRPRGRPPKGRRRQQISLYLYPEELDAIDAARGSQDRNAWIRDRLGLPTEAARRTRPTGAEGE